MTFHAPQIIWIILVSLKLIVTAYKHGQPKLDPDGTPATYQFGPTVFVALVFFGLYYWGGFFG